MAVPAGDTLWIYTARYGGHVRLGSLLNVIVIDGELVIGGSFNDTKAAQDKNAENVEITRDKAVAAKYTANWQTHAQHSEPYAGRGMGR
jgi:hypothetical protein